MKKLLRLLLPSNVQTLQEESKNIIDVFTSTQDSLKDVNSRAEEEKKKQQDIQAKAQKVIWDLDLITQGNDKVIKNIDKILE